MLKGGAMAPWSPLDPLTYITNLIITHQTQRTLRRVCLGLGIGIYLHNVHINTLWCVLPTIYMHMYVGTSVLLKF